MWKGINRNRGVTDSSVDFFYHVFSHRRQPTQTKFSSAIHDLFYMVFHTWYCNGIYAFMMELSQNNNCCVSGHRQVRASLSFLRDAWWRQQMETFSASLAICAGNSLVTGWFPSQRSVTRTSDVFFDLHLNKRLSKQSWGWWFETSWWPLWRHWNVTSNRSLHFVIFWQSTIDAKHNAINIYIAQYTYKKTTEMMYYVKLNTMKVT